MTVVPMLRLINVNNLKSLLLSGNTMVKCHNSFCCLLTCCVEQKEQIEKAEEKERLQKEKEEQERKEAKDKANPGKTKTEEEAKQHSSEDVENSDGEDRRTESTYEEKIGILEGSHSSQVRFIAYMAVLFPSYSATWRILQINM